MKNLLFAVLLFAGHINLFGQEPGISKSDFLSKAKKQNTAGWFILGTGFTITTIGLFVEMNEATTELAYALTFQPREQNSAGGMLLIGGSAIMAGSIPFFIASTKNRKRTTTAFIKMESQTELRNNSFVKTSFPAIGIRVVL